MTKYIMLFWRMILGERLISGFLPNDVWRKDFQGMTYMVVNVSRWALPPSDDFPATVNLAKIALKNKGC